MVRSVSETLTAAQSAASRTPYFHLVFTSYDTETQYDLSTSSETYGNRILLIDHSEEPYNDYAVIVLRNYDRSLPTNLTGYWTQIGYGDKTGEGNEYASTARLWVKHHQEVSAGGKVLTILELEGVWSKLRDTKMRLGSPPFYNTAYTGQTIYALIGIILAEIDPAMSLDAFSEDDGITNTYQPKFSVNEAELFEDAASLIYRLVKMTKSYLRSKATLKFEVKYPQDGDSVELTYNSGESPYFYEYAERKNILIPNHIYLFSNQGVDGLWLNIIASEAIDQDSIDRYGDTPDVYLAPEITSQGDSDNRAAAILARMKAEALAGMLVIPHDYQMELYDKIAIEDLRGM